jgi:hypothetical protein
MEQGQHGGSVTSGTGRSFAPKTTEAASGSPGGLTMRITLVRPPYGIASTRRKFWTFIALGFIALGFIALGFIALGFIALGFIAQR